MTGMALVNIPQAWLRNIVTVDVRSGSPYTPSSPTQIPFTKEVPPYLQYNTLLTVNPDGTITFLRNGIYLILLSRNIQITKGASSPSTTIKQMLRIVRENAYYQSITRFSTIDPSKTSDQGFDFEDTLNIEGIFLFNAGEKLDCLDYIALDSGSDDTVSLAVATLTVIELTGPELVPYTPYSIG